MKSDNPKLEETREKRWGPTGRPLAGLLLTLALLAVLYGATLFPGPGGRINVGDSAKFQYIGAVLGVPHHPGYPQYVVLNHLWTRLPLPLDLATKVNLLSAVLSLVAAGFLYSAVWRVTRSLPTSVLATLGAMLTRSIWSFSTEAEVYALHLAYAAALLWAVVRFRQERRPGWLVVAGLVFGLSLGNHPTSVLFLPGLMLIAMTPTARAWGKRKVAVLALAALALGLVQYTFLLWRSHSDAPFVEAIEREADLEDLGETLSGSRFTSKNVLKKGIPGVGDRLVQIPNKLAEQMWVLPLGLAILGAITLHRRDRAMLAFLLASAVAFVLFISIYHIGDWVAYLAPLWLMTALLAAIGLNHGLAGRKRLQSIATAAWAVILVALVVTNALLLYVSQNRWERSWLIAEAGLGEQVVTYRGPGYRHRQLNNYYRYGVLQSGPPAVHTAVEAIQRLIFLGDDELIFSSEHVRAFFERHRVQYSERWSPDGRMYYQTTTQYPIRTLVVRPGRILGLGPRNRVELADGKAILDADAAIEIAVIAGGGDRLKGVVEFSDRRDRLGAKGAKVETLLREVRPGDWIVLAINEPYMARSKKVRRLFGNWSGFDIAPPPSNDDGLLVIGIKGTRAPHWQLTDPTSIVEVDLDG